MLLARTIIGTPLGEMVALASSEGLCAPQNLRERRALRDFVIHVVKTAVRF